MYFMPKGTTITSGKLISGMEKIVLGATGIFLAGGMTVAGILYSTKRIIPFDMDVQNGYVAPYDITIDCKDLDENGEGETVMKIEGGMYLLRKINGKPVLSEYRVSPKKIIPKE